MLGYAPGWKHFMELDPLGSNQQGRQIPQGQLIVFTPHVSYHVDGDFQPIEVENPAKYYADNLDFNFHIGENDWGYRTLGFLTNLPYDKTTGQDEAQKYFDVVHPTLACEMGLETPTGDNYDVPVPCPTCRLKWLESTECEAAIQGSSLDYHLLTELKDTLIQSQKAALTFARKKLDETNGDIQSSRAGSPGKRAYQDCDRHYMAMLHEKAPEVKQAELMNDQARIQGEAIAKGVAAAVGNIQPAAPVLSDADRQEYEDFLAFKKMKAEMLEGDKTKGKKKTD